MAAGRLSLELELDLGDAMCSTELPQASFREAKRADSWSVEPICGLDVGGDFSSHDQDLMNLLLDAGGSSLEFKPCLEPSVTRDPDSTQSGLPGCPTWSTADSVFSLSVSLSEDTAHHAPSAAAAAAAGAAPTAGTPLDPFAEPPSSGRSSHGLSPPWLWPASLQRSASGASGGHASGGHAYPGSATTAGPAPAASLNSLDSPSLKRDRLASSSRPSDLATTSRLTASPILHLGGPTSALDDLSFQHLGLPVLGMPGGFGASSGGGFGASSGGGGGISGELDALLRGALPLNSKPFPRRKLTNVRRGGGGGGGWDPSAAFGGSGWGSDQILPPPPHLLNSGACSGASTPFGIMDSMEMMPGDNSNWLMQSAPVSVYHTGPDDPSYFLPSWSKPLPLLPMPQQASVRRHSGDDAPLMAGGGGASAAAAPRVSGPTSSHLLPGGLSAGVPLFLGAQGGLMRRLSDDNSLCSLPSHLVSHLPGSFASGGGAPPLRPTSVEYASEFSTLLAAVLASGQPVGIQAPAPAEMDVGGYDNDGGEGGAADKAHCVLREYTLRRRPGATSSYRSVVDRINDPGALTSSPSAPENMEWPSQVDADAEADLAGDLERFAVKPTIQALRQLFPLSLKAASAQVGISVSRMKKVCRQLGVASWPHRKLRSLQNLHRSVTDDLALGDEERAAVLARIELGGAHLQADPCAGIPRDLDDLRQATYKLRHERSGKVKRHQSQQHLSHHHAGGGGRASALSSHHSDDFGGGSL